MRIIIDKDELKELTAMTQKDMDRMVRGFETGVDDIIANILSFLEVEVVD